MTVFTLAFELVAVEPPLIFKVLPSVFAELPVLPANVIGLTTYVFKFASAVPTLLAAA